MAKLLALDLEASYPTTPRGFDSRLLDRDGRRRLDWRFWDIGRQALGLLTRALTDEGVAPPSPSAIGEALPQLELAGTEFLDSDFYPTFLELFDGGMLGADIDRAGLETAWTDFEFPDKVELFTQTVVANALALSEVQEFVPFVQQLTAIAVLRWLDDAVIAESLGGRGLPSLISGLERLAPHLNAPTHLFTAFEEAKRLALAEKAALGAERKHAPMKEARAWVCAQWQAESSEYGGNKSAFARVYARLVPQKFTTTKGDPLTVTETQIRNVWLRDCRSAGKPIGLPADRE